MGNSDNKTDLLRQIDSPEDLRRLPVERLKEVCRELRTFLIDNLSVHPGHFASSMGAVEITVALHYVFNTPYDRIVWDVGHQAYSHKILTGRRDKFCTLRQKGGISGFPNPDESEADAFEAGHASNSISAALGMAIASNLSEQDRNVVAVIGDASISGGLAFEGLNNAACNKNNLLIILNDNDMAIDHNVGALNNYMTQLTTSTRYNNFRYNLYGLLRRVGLVDESNKYKFIRFNNSLKSLVANTQNIFEGLDIRYFGTVDGHDVEGLVKVLRDIKDMKGPRLLHIRTRKGYGYKVAEKDPTTWHAPGRFDKLTGEIVKPQSTGSPAPIKFQQVFGHTIVELAEKNPKIVGITAAMSTGTSLNMLAERFPKRTFDVGISEGHAVTFSGGLAKEGMRPFCCIYSTFLQRAFDNVIFDVATMRLPVTFCIDRGGLVGEDGETHQGAFDLAYMRIIPNMIVSAPMDEHTLRNLLYTSLQQSESPFAIRYPRGAGENPDWRNTMQALPIGRGRKLAEGSDIAILSIGTIGIEVRRALSLLQAEGIRASHYDMIFLKPIDEDILREVTESFDTIVTVEDGTVNGGLGSCVMEWCNDNARPCRVVRLGLPDEFIKHATIAQQKEYCGIDASSIADRVRQLIKK